MRLKSKIKRVYDKPVASDGFRVLIDRLWPRGLSKEDAKVGLWMKDVAPSAGLRSWFHVDKVKRLAEFEKRYQGELTASRKADDLKRLLKDKAQATLVTAVKDMKYSHIPVLLKTLEVSRAG